MKTNRLSSSFLFGGFWLIISTCLLLLVGYGQIKPGVEQLIIVAGMSLAAAFSALQTLADWPVRPITTGISFNEVLIRRNLAEAGLDQAKTLPQPVPEWELTPSKIVGIDKTLALAKLRIEIEQELRRIGLTHHIPPSSAIRLASDLVNAGVLSANLQIALKDILVVCNQAIHGAEVDSEIAVAVVNAGDQLLSQLASL